MSKSLPVDVNSRPVPALKLGFGKTFNIGLTTEEINGNIVRMKAIGNTVIRMSNQPGSQIILNDGDTEYFMIPQEGGILEIVSGSINLMW